MQGAPLGGGLGEGDPGGYLQERSSAGAPGKPRSPCAGSHPLPTLSRVGSALPPAPIHATACRACSSPCCGGWARTFGTSRRPPRSEQAPQPRPGCFSASRCPGVCSLETALDRALLPAPAQPVTLLTALLCVSSLPQFLGDVAALFCCSAVTTECQGPPTLPSVAVRRPLASPKHPSQACACPEVGGYSSSGGSCASGLT